MLLAIDAGNTNVVFALLDAGTIRARWRIATDPRFDASAHAEIKQYLVAHEKSDVAAALAVAEVAEDEDEDEDTDEVEQIF